MKSKSHAAAITSLIGIRANGGQNHQRRMLVMVVFLQDRNLAFGPKQVPRLEAQQISSRQHAMWVVDAM